MATTSHSIRVNRILGCCAIFHAAFILLTLRVVMPVRLPDWWYDNTTWVVLASLWPLWLVVLALHPGRSWTRLTLPTLIGLLLLLPCIRFFSREAPEAFGFSRMPTLDKPIVERAQDLGAGFRQVMLAEFITGGFESIYHGEYLYFQDRQLGDFVSSSVAPSQRLAAFVKSDLDSPLRDDHFGFHVFVFRAIDQKSIQLTQELRYDWAGFEWDEAGGYLVLLHRHDPPERFALPQA